MGFVWRSGPGWMIASFILIVISAALPLGLLYTIKLIVDLATAPISGDAAAGIGESLDIQQMLIYVGMAGGIAVLQSLAAAATRWVGEAQSQAVTDTMYGVLHEKSMEVDLSYYENAGFKDKLHRAQREAPYRPRRMVASLTEVGLNGMTLLGMAGLLISYHWAVLPVLVLSSLPGVFLRLKYSSHFYSWERKATARDRESLYTNMLLTTVEFAKELRLFGLGKMFRERFNGLRDGLRAEKLTITRQRSFAEFVGEALAVLGVFGVLGAMCISALTGAIAVGGLVMYHGALQKAWSSLGLTLRGVSLLYEDNLFVADLFEFLAVKPQVTSPANPKPTPNPKSATLKLENVTFHYPHDERIVLRNLNLEIAPGEHVALVGTNGCGKTTLVKLLCRLYEPTKGSIQLGGVTLPELELDDYRSKIGVLMQDFCRYQMSLRENVWLGDISRGPNDPNIDLAIADASIDKLIANLPEGVESMLGTTFTGGHELSTGQWQKIALARMLARDAPILLLDEPTSALDAQAEEELISKLREVAVGRTTLLISHRLAAIQNLHRIIYLENGSITESGTHAELLALGGGYAHLWELQSRHYR